MITMDVTYTNLDGEVVTEPHHFNLTAEEVLEKELKYKGLEETMQRLSETEDGHAAYMLFKDIILNTYGIREGKFFRKQDPDTGRLYVNDFIDSGAAGALCLEFVQNPIKGADFIQGCLPPKAELDRLEANAPTEAEQAEIQRLVAESRQPQDFKQKKQAVIDQLPGDDGEEYTGPRGGRVVKPNLESRKVTDVELPEESLEQGADEEPTPPDLYKYKIIPQADADEMSGAELRRLLAAGYKIEE